MYYNRTNLAHEFYPYRDHDLSEEVIQDIVTYVRIPSLQIVGFVYQLADKWGKGNRLCPSDREEILQNSVIRMISIISRQAYNPSRSSFKTFTTMIVRHEISDFLHARGKRRQKSLENIDLPDSRSLSAEDRVLIRDLVDRAIDLLPRIDRKPAEKLELAVREGLSHQAIADRCGQSRDTVKKDLQRMKRDWIDMIREDLHLSPYQANSLVTYILDPRRTISLAPGNGDHKYN